MKMSERDFLIMLVNKELEEEARTTNNREWLVMLIKAKDWLLKRKRLNGIEAIIASEDIASDIEKYLN